MVVLTLSGLVVVVTGLLQHLQSVFDLGQIHIILAGGRLHQFSFFFCHFPLFALGFLSIFDVYPKVVVELLKVYLLLVVLHPLEILGFASKYIPDAVLKGLAPFASHLQFRGNLLQVRLCFLEVLILMVSDRLIIQIVTALSFVKGLLRTVVQGL